MSTKNKKAQVWTTDFSLSLLVFVIAIVLFGRAITNLSSSTGENIDDLVSEGRLVTDSLTSEGYPSNWTVANVKRVGLMGQGKLLENDKLQNMLNMTYQDAREILGTKYDYFLFFIDEKGELVNVSENLGVGHPNVYAIGSRKDTNTIAYYQKENLLLDEMQELNATVFTGGSKSQFIGNITNYEVLVMEDPHFSDIEIDVVEEYVLEGGKLIITEHITDTSGTYFGVNFVHRSMNAGNELATVISADSNMPFSIGETYTPREYPYIDAAHIDKIATYPDGKVAMATFGYGSGKVYYLSDSDNPDYLGDFEEEIKTATTNFLLEERPENYVELNQIQYNKLVTITRLIVMNGKVTRMVLYIWD